VLLLSGSQQLLLIILSSLVLIASWCVNGGGVNGGGIVLTSDSMSHKVSPESLLKTLIRMGSPSLTLMGSSRGKQAQTGPLEPPRRELLIVPWISIALGVATPPIPGSSYVMQIV
jgi:hypothetical protein